MNRRIGLIAVIGIWLTAGIALPLVNVLHTFSATQLMFFRGAGTALLALALLKGMPERLNRNTIALMMVLPMATLGLYQGVRLWGAGPTIILLTATPVINGLWAWIKGQRISVSTLTGFTFVIGGVYLAQDTVPFSLSGFLWATFATVTNGILYELFKQVDGSAYQKCFVTAVGMAVLGLLLSIGDQWTSSMFEHTVAALMVFVLVGGLLYWLSNLYTFKHLPTVEGSVLAQGEAPAVVIGAWLILGEVPSLQQGLGVCLSLVGLYFVINWLEKPTQH